MVITDSGGLQEETSALGVLSLTIQENTERPATVSEGTNTLVGTDMGLLRSEVDKVLSGKGKSRWIPPLWDGSASGRIVDVVLGTRWHPSSCGTARSVSGERENSIRFDVSSQAGG